MNYNKKSEDRLNSRIKAVLYCFKEKKYKGANNFANEKLILQIKTMICIIINRKKGNFTIIET